MKKFLPVFILLLFSASSAFAQFVPPFGGGLNTKVQGSVGEYYLSVSGFSSPNATITLIIGGVVIRTTIAQPDGSFSISQVLVKPGLTDFCLQAIDFQKIGVSQTCINLSPINSSLDIKNIYLPPTLALSKSEIAVGEVTKAYGFTMPNAEVTIYLSNGTKLTGKADSNGYFSFDLKNLKVGKYTIYAGAKYNGIESLSPTTKLSVNVITKPEQVAKKAVGEVGNAGKSIWDLLTSWGLGILWIAIAIIILIIILIFKLWGDKFSSIFKLPKLPKPSFSIPFAIGRKKHLHHYWYFGF